MYGANSSRLYFSAANSNKNGSYLASLLEVHFEQKLMGCHLVTSFPLVSTSVKACEMNLANPFMHPSVVIQNGRPSYWGGRRRGSCDKRHFRVTNAFCCSSVHFSFSDEEARACLYAPFRACQLLLGCLTFTSLVRSERGAVIQA